MVGPVDHSATFRSLLPELVEACRRAYGGRLISVVIFGSVGRGAPAAESDIDILVVANDLPRGRIPRVQEFEQVESSMRPALARARAAGVNTRLSPVLKTTEEVWVGSPLFLDLTEDAKILHDRDRFFERYLEDLRARLGRLGAKRVWRGSAWYWDLKPDYRPGEIFEV